MWTILNVVNFLNILILSDAILPRRGPITRAMARRLQEDWAIDTGECPKVLMSLRVDFGLMD